MVYEIHFLSLGLCTVAEGYALRDALGYILTGLVAFALFHLMNAEPVSFCSFEILSLIDALGVNF